MLSGNVQVKVQDGILFLRGDDQGSQITIQSPGRYTRVLVDRGDDTKLNGSTRKMKFLNFIGTLNIDLGGGDNRLRIHNLDAHGGLIVRSAGGNDAIDIDGSSFGGGLSIGTGDGADRVNVIQCTILGRTGIHAGDHSDIVTLHDSTFGGDTLVKGGRGADTLNYADSDFKSDVSIEGDEGADLISDESTVLHWDFRNGAQGWDADAAEYRADDNVFRSALEALPAELRTSGTGFLLSGKNHSDDMFMYLKRMIGGDLGLRPSTTYQLEFDIKFASSAPSGALGAGGPPGEGVWLKAGGGDQEPRTFIDDAGMIQINVTHGLALDSYTSTVSNVANGLAFQPELPFRSLERVHVHRGIVTTDAQGRLWLLIGTDSGFEGTTTLYYQEVTVRLIQVLAKTGAPLASPKSIVMD